MYRYSRMNFKKTILPIGLAILLFIMASTVSPAGKSARKGYLGVSIERLSKEDREELSVSHGVLVTRVVAKSPAEKAGILEDDIIQYFDGQKIRRPDNLVDAVRQTKPNSTVKVTCMRDGKRMDLDVIVGKLRTSRLFSWGDGDHFIIRGGGAYLGVQLHEMNEDLSAYFNVQEDGGALVLDVEEDSPASKTGIKAGDVIVSIDGDEVMDPQDAHDILSDFEEGDEVEITVIRKKQKQTMNVELGERPRHHSMKILRGFRGDGDRHYDVNVPDPRHFDIDIPDCDCEFDLQHDVDVHIQKDMRRLREKLDSMQDKIEDKTGDIESTLDRIGKVHWI